MATLRSAVPAMVDLVLARALARDPAEHRSALAFVDQIGDRLGKPSVQKWYAWMLLRRAAPGDRDQARALLDEAIPAFGSMGMTPSLTQSEELRRNCQRLLRTEPSHTM